MYFSLKCLEHSLHIQILSIFHLESLRVSLIKFEHLMYYKRFSAHHFKKPNIVLAYKALVHPSIEYSTHTRNSKRPPPNEQKKFMIPLTRSSMLAALHQVEYVLYEVRMFLTTDIASPKIKTQLIKRRGRSNGSI